MGTLALWSMVKKIKRDQDSVCYDVVRPYHTIRYLTLQDTKTYGTLCIAYDVDVWYGIGTIMYGTVPYRTVLYRTVRYYYGTALYGRMVRLIYRYRTVWFYFIRTVYWIAYVV